MSLSSITTSILNSMGLEQRTLIYFIISGIFMLIAVYLLPQFIGIYSLLVGFTFIYGLTSILNLILLHRNCPKKPAYLKFSTYAVAFLIPTCILGVMLENLLLPILGSFLTLIVCMTIMISFNILLFVVFGLIKLDMFKNKFKGNLKRKSSTQISCAER